MEGGDPLLPLLSCGQRGLNNYPRTQVSTWGDVAALRAEAEQQRRLLAASDDDADPTSAGDCGRCPPADGPASPGASAGDAAHARPALPASVTASLDVAVTLGGDGTILWLSQLIGSGAVPPIVSFRCVVVRAQALCLRVRRSARHHVSSPACFPPPHAASARCAS